MYAHTLSSQKKELNILCYLINDFVSVLPGTNIKTHLKKTFRELYVHGSYTLRKKSLTSQFC